MGAVAVGAISAHAAGGCRTTCAASSSAPQSTVLDQVTTVGRVRPAGRGVRYTWPGVYFEGRFRGTGVGLMLKDSVNDYVVQVDGATAGTLMRPGDTTYWVRNLAAGNHTVRLTKRTESPWNAGEFDGLVPAAGGAILARPAARSRQIEFIGDSWTVGYGDLSTSPDCRGNAVIGRNTDTGASFGALTAKALDADYQIDAWSGLGLVRNYKGQGGGNLLSYYDTDLQAVPGSRAWPVPRTWRPQVVVVGLGNNDFSAALHAGEKWATIGQLAADYRTAYLAFLDKLRTRYGAGTYIVLAYPDLYRTTALAASIQQIVKARNTAGDARISGLHYDDTALGLDHLGCDRHPSRHDHRLLAAALTKHLVALPLAW
ncbi:SGNH/GDSL hydrolase family protein [Actinoplanes sp. NPDC051343]|uniref:SGNH/GDSL hydrolase family protein n=1 Tax=Actinoplanes sp. NPDC051343 TaxID=3363906 RepID=UPI00378CE815